MDQLDFFIVTHAKQQVLTPFKDAARKRSSTHYSFDSVLTTDRSTSNHEAKHDQSDKHHAVYQHGSTVPHNRLLS